MTDPPFLSITLWAPYRFYGQNKSNKKNTFPIPLFHRHVRKKELFNAFPNKTRFSGSLNTCVNPFWSWRALSTARYTYSATPTTHTDTPPGSNSRQRPPQQQQQQLRPQQQQQQQQPQRPDRCSEVGPVANILRSGAQVGLLYFQVLES